MEFRVSLSLMVLGLVLGFGCGVETAPREGNQDCPLVREVFGLEGELYLTAGNCDGRGNCPDERDRLLKIVPS